MDDERFDYFSTNITAACDTQHIESIKDIKNQVADSAAVQDFLNDPSVNSLEVVCFEDGRLTFAVNIGSSSSSSSSDRSADGSIRLHFVKHSISPPLSPENIAKYVDVHTWQGDCAPLDSLYTALHGIWNPMLLGEGVGKGSGKSGAISGQQYKVTPRIQQLLTELEATLKVSVHQGVNSEEATRGPSRRSEGNINNFIDIHEPVDEINYWDKLKNDSRSNYKGLARAVDEALSDICVSSASSDQGGTGGGNLSGFNCSNEEFLAMDITECTRVVDKCLDALNTVWNVVLPGTSSGDDIVYPQARMTHFFDILSSAISRYVLHYLGSTNVWYDRLSDVRVKLLYAIQLLQLWSDIPKKLTSTYWVSRGIEHRWEGEPHIDGYAERFCARLNDVLSIRTLAEELTLLLTQDERASFQLNKLFLPLENTRPLAYNPYTEPQWLKAKGEYEKRVEPIEAAVATRFRRTLSTALDKPQLLLNEFQKYRNLVRRPSIRRALASERDSLLALLKDVVKQHSSVVDRIENYQYDARGGGGAEDDLSSSNKLTSPNIQNIIMLRQLTAKVASILSTSREILNDLSDFDLFANQCENLLGRIKAEENTLYNNWVNRVNEAISNDDPEFRLQGALMGLQDGVLVVNFSEHLIRFLRDTRQLDELGFDIPKGSTRKGRKSDREGGKVLSIAEKAMEAERYYRYGILLRKTANFYNTIGEQIVDVQQELLLESLMSFTNMVTTKASSWNNPIECETYIRKIQEAAEALSLENRNLRKLHEFFIQQTVGLMNIDLLRQADIWKAKWRTMKEKINALKIRYKEKDARNWIRHWDFQIYKALEASYQMGLESLNENLPEMKIEIIFTNKRLEFKPPLEQIRQSYYSEMRRFAALPSSFEGFGGNGDIFKKMGVKNSKRLVQVYAKAEGLFDQLSALLKKYAPWVRLGQIDLDAFVEANVHTPEEFSTNFKNLRVRRKEIDHIPDYIKVDCCMVSLVPFKSSIDQLLQSLNDTLLVTLRRSLLNEFKEVDSFLETSQERLNTRPHSVEEIGNAKTHWKEIDVRQSEMKTASKNCVDKKKLLMQYTPGTAVDISEVTSRMSNLDGEGGRWDDFDIGLEAFNEMIEEQKEALKGTLDEDVVKVNQDIDKFSSRWRQLKPSEVKDWGFAEVQKIFDSLDDWKTQLEELKEKSTALEEACLTFAMPRPRFDGLEDIVLDVANTTKSWDMLKEYNTELKVMSDQEWLSFSVNVYALADFATQWNDKLKASFTKGSYDNVIEYIVTEIDKIKKSIPALKYCRGEPFKEDHWTELLHGKLQLPRDVRRENVKLEHFLSRLDILMEPPVLSFVKDLQARALGEVQIREALQELKVWERTAEVKMLTTEDSGRRIPLIKDWKDLFLEMGDKQSLLASLKESQFFKAFADQGIALEAKMSILDGGLHTINAIQRKWVYLEPIFGRGALPAEEARFMRVDEEFSDIMIVMVKEPKLFALADEHLFPQLVDRLKTMLDQLERCQKALADFLEAKRSAMPRFYFIGDDDLLEILGQAKNPAVIQSHLKKLFQGIHKVQFSEDITLITAIVSSAGEVVTLENPVKVNEKVEDWLELLSNEMRSTLATSLVKCLDYKKGFNWDFPSQILCLAQYVRFTSMAENCLDDDEATVRRSLEDLHSMLKKTLFSLTSGETDQTDGLLQLKIKNLVYDIVHQIDVVGMLLENRTQRSTDWLWKKQLRYYMDSKGELCVIRMVDAEFAYTYEYQGNAPKLVHTPLTDKCYLTLTQGMHMGFGGNPYGPAGTGKTESVKALAGAFGRQALVFNCDEGIDFLSMGRIFIGLVKCGAWGCFDEFNRLKEDQLSAISQQIQIIVEAIKAKQSPIQLLDRSVNVDFNAGIFVTLNPAGKGYGGRSRLPDNLKALFRPVAMGAPDNELIAEVNMVTEGFTQAKSLASKIVSLFRLSKQLLSNQQHYDWGLRALKAVLNSGGRLIQACKREGKELTADMESEILIKAMRVNTLSKLTFSDTLKFLALIGDVFPGVDSSDITGGELEEAIRQVMKEKPFHLVEDETQVRKMMQLKESLDQRMGCVVVGPSGCGKSTLWRVLKAAMIKCGQAVVAYVMNPKSMPRERLLGHMDLDTREWADGVLTDAARKVVRESQDVRCWIVCDGDVDPEWIESLNSVLDDNHLLTLPNGERINFGPNVNFLFETHDLKFASPATVSRMGMIFLSDDDLDVRRIIQRWVSIFPSDKQMTMSKWLDELFYRALDYIVKAGEYVVETTLVGTVMNGLSQIKHASTRQEFIVGVIKGLGGNLSISNRTTFAKDVFQWASERPPDIGSPLDCKGEGSNFVPYTGAAGSQAHISVRDLGESGAVIQTVTVQRTLSVVDSWINNMEPFILVGPEGCGKSMMINYAFKKRKNIGIATLHCNAQTTADDVITKISQLCSLFSSPDGRIYRPRDCERLVLYLKDINLPRPDMYDTCQLIAFLQQLITFDGFYDENLEFLKLERIQIVASINAGTTVGRHPLTSRFTAVVRICVCDYPDTSELISVYDAYLSAVLNKGTALLDKKWGTSSQEREKLANAMVDIYQKTRERFTVDDHRHYLFTPRDVTKWVKNLCRYELSTEELMEVLIHEANRIFRDRLVGSDACSKFDQIVTGALRAHFRYATPSGQPSSYFTCLTSPRGNQGSSTTKSEGKDGESQVDSGGIIARMSEDDFRKLVQQGLIYYEREERDLNMLLFPESLETIAHIDRVLTSFSGHMLLVGRAGVGRRSALTVASYMLGYEVHTPAISRDYSLKQFNGDVKNVLQIAGVRGEHVVLLIEDFQIAGAEAMLEIVNSLLSAGEVPGLYDNQELEPLLAPLRELMRQEAEVFRTPYDYFVSRVKKYLHIALCVDPQHPKFLYRCESNPALYAQCAVMWIGEWRTQSLKTIPLLLEGVKDLIEESAEGGGDGEEAKGGGDDNEGKSGGDGKDGEEGKNSGGRSRRGRDRARDGGADSPLPSADDLVETLLAIHKSCITQLGATPGDYISFLKLWFHLYTLKKHELKSELGHLEAGLFKLDSAGEIVNDLRTNAVQQQKDLIVAQAAADRAMDEISKALSGATERRREVQDIKVTVAENEVTTKERKAEIENQLSDIEPVLAGAKEKVGQIKSEHMHEIKSLTAPPVAIADVLEAVLMMLGVQDTSWLSMKRFLGSRGVKEDILNFDATRMTPELRKQVTKHVKAHHTSFEESTIQRVSVAAAPMAAWVIANLKYARVIEQIEPLRNELDEEVLKLEQSQKRLQKCEDELNSLDDRVAALKQEFAEKTGEADRLKRNLALAGTTLDKAETLINQLSGEQARWKVQASQLRSDLGKLPMRIMLAAGFSTYLGKTPEDVRSQMLSKWEEISDIKQFSYKRLLSTESQLLQWKSLGLPSDDLSQENALVITNNSERIAFIIDPANAATDWLKSVLRGDDNSSSSNGGNSGSSNHNKKSNKEASRPLEVVSHHDTRFTNQVELAVRFGKALIILEVDGVEPMLYPLVRKDLVHQGPRFVVSVGDKVIDYNENFRLYLVTRNPNPDLPPDAAALVSVINFTVTRSGLEGQLLGVAIQHEQPELELAKGELLRKEESFKVQLAKLEKDLLETLATAEGNLLENVALIESLTKTKEMSAEIAEALKTSAETSAELDLQRDIYRGFAVNGSKLFFLVKSLESVNHMYQFSLASFLTLFKETLTTPMDKNLAVEDRLVKLCADMEVRLLFFIGRALFKADRPMFALHLVKGMHPEHFQPKEWEIFTGSLVASVSDAVPKGFPSWAGTDRQGAFRLLSEMIPHTVHALELDTNAKWTRFASSMEAERDVPQLRGISPFQKVLVIQAFRPDRLQSAIIQFLCDILKIESVSPPPLSLVSMLEESSNATPILLIQSPGADVSKELQEYAAKTVGPSQYEELAMGGGQQEVAMHMLRAAAKQGTWLCLKNLHLVVAWLPNLEKELSSLEAHPDFRLWITSESHHHFPSILLQLSLKATYESPPGVKKNLQRTLESWESSDVSFDAERNPLRCRLLFLLACFHAVMQERRTYIPQGWTKFYEFSYGDLKAGTYVMEAMSLDGVDARSIDWETIYGLMEDAIYGGRVEGVYDLRVLRAHLR